MKPWPGVFTYLDGKILKILEVKIIDSEEAGVEFGKVVDGEKFIVNTGKGTIQIDRVQLEGKKAVAKDEFLRGHKIKEGTMLGQ